MDVRTQDRWAAHMGRVPDLSAGRKVDGTLEVGVGPDAGAFTEVQRPLDDGGRVHASQQRGRHADREGVEPLEDLPWRVHLEQGAEGLRNAREIEQLGRRWHAPV